MILQQLGYEAENYSVLCCFRPWIEALLHSATNLTALSILANGAVRPAALRPLRALRHLELVLSEPQLCTRTLSQLMAELPHCCALEMLTLQHVESTPRWSDRSDFPLPDMCFDRMAALHHVQLKGCFPSGRLRLPPACTVRLDVVLMEDELYEQLCEEEWNAIAKSVRLLTLGQSCLAAWPAGLQELSKLHYLELYYEYCAPVQPLDLIVLRDIPHVALSFRRSAKLHYTGGAWKSICIANACVDFTNVDDFVTGTECFFIFCMVGLSWPTTAAIEEACRWNRVDWFQWGNDFTDTNAGIYLRGISNTEDFVEGRYKRGLVTPQDFWPSNDMRACFSADVWREYVHPIQEEQSCPSPSKIVLEIFDCCDRLYMR